VRAISRLRRSKTKKAGQGDSLAKLWPAPAVEVLIFSTASLKRNWVRYSFGIDRVVDGITGRNTDWPGALLRVRASLSLIWCVLPLLSVDTAFKGFLDG